MPIWFENLLWYHLRLSDCFPIFFCCCPHVRARSILILLSLWSCFCFLLRHCYITTCHLRWLNHHWLPEKKKFFFSCSRVCGPMRLPSVSQLQQRAFSSHRRMQRGTWICMWKPKPMWRNVVYGEFLSMVCALQPVSTSCKITLEPKSGQKGEPKETVEKTVDHRAEVIF